MPTAKKLKSAGLVVIEGGQGPVSDSSTLGNKYETLFDQASDAIIAVTSDGRIDAANQAMEELTGFMKSELAGASVGRFIPDSGKQHLQPHARPLQSEMFRVPGTYEDVAIVRNDGYIRFVDLSVRIVENGREPLALALFRDVTEKKQMERELITKHAELRNAYYQLEKKNAELQVMQEQLVQAGKMAALGELATGIAHELNQPLQAIRGYAQELGDFIPKEPVSESALKEIVSSVDKMSSIIGYLRSFVSKSVEKHEMTDLHFAIEEALKMLSRQFAARGIEVERDFGDGLPKVYANPLQLEQVFINLATNARDAIEATGRGKGRIRISTRMAGAMVEVGFRDDGCGMTEKTRSKIFNPFFTTKEVGKGMGLGLSLSYGMISKLHGSILVESEIGKGTAFLIRIPKDFRELG